MIEPQHLFFSLNGRICRKSWWIGLVILALAALVLMFALTSLLGITTADMAQKPPLKKVLQMHLILGLITLWPSFALNLKRLHDRNRATAFLVLFYALNYLVTGLQYFDLTGPPEKPSGAFLAVSLIMVVVTLWLVIELGFLRGTEGENRYGPDPLSCKDQPPETSALESPETSDKHSDKG